MRKPMSSFQGWVVIGLLATLLIAGMVNFSVARLPSRPRWEFMLAAPRDEELEKQLDLLGLDGWEVISARRATSSDPTKRVGYELILKRSRP